METPLEWTLALLALGCFIGLIAGWASKAPPRPRVRLLNKPHETNLEVLVPPGPPKRLVPSDAPNATKPRGPRAPLTRHPPGPVTHVDYLAPFAGSGNGSEAERVDYLLLSSDERH
jgi:hypothetical protein